MNGLAPGTIEKARRATRHLFAFLLCLTALLPAQARWADAAEVVDLELLLAVDISLSVSSSEYNLQMQGLAEAFRNPAVHRAIQAAGDHGIAVSIMQWSDRSQQHMSVPWTRIRGEGQALELASLIAATPRAFGGAGTSIGGAIKAALPRFFENDFVAPRRVIDISGDGGDNRGPSPEYLRSSARSAGVTINGLAILNEDTNLDLYYERRVIVGTGAFVIAAADYEDFARAIITKLVREISTGPIADATPAEHQLTER